MLNKVKRRVGAILVLLTLIWQSAFPMMAYAYGGSQKSDFVRRVGSVLKLGGKEFRFAGSNNYYLMYKSQFMVDDVIDTAHAQGFNVLRIWGSLDIGDPNDSSTSLRGPSEGVYFQYWDSSAMAPAYNDGADGLERLDYVIYKAGQAGIKLVIPFVNNWNDFGGMDQYVRWRDISTPDDQTWYHDSFYSDPVIRQWYKDWIAHLLNRTNIYTGLKYKNDPTIMTWELGNEPRCLSAGAYPRSANCTTQTLINWADDVSHFIKKTDKNHLVSVGDEGFYCIPGATDWTENCGEGVDTIAFAKLKNIDVMSFHLYPNSWGKDADWGTEWIQRHFRDASKVHKPTMLGEYGFLDKSTRNVVYKQWTDAVVRNKGTGALYWILSGYQDDGSLYPDYDGFTVYCPSPVCTALSNFADMQAALRPLYFPPVADNDSVVTEFDIPAALNAPANDIAYGHAVVLPDSLDLDPATDGKQTSFTVAGGTFVAASDGTVTFTPNAGFVGKAEASYVIEDSFGKKSNVASIVVNVKPDPTAAILLASFETGTEGWASANWQTNAGTTEQSADFATEGSYGLKLVTADGGWFGLNFPTPADLTGKTHIKVDLRTLGAGTSQDIALQFGSSYQWCQGNFTYVNGNTDATTDVDMLTSFSCDISTLPMNDVKAIWIYFSGGGTYYIDNVRAE